MRKVSYALMERHTKAFIQTYRKIRADSRALVEAIGFKGQFPSRVMMVQPGAYKHFRRSEAISQFLTTCAVPQLSTHIAAALERGQVKSEADDNLKATYATLSYGKNTGRFRRFGTKHWTYGI